MAVRDIIQAAAGASSGSTSTAVYVEDVFSTYLYTGNGSTQTITNGIDLATYGGLVWFKTRPSGSTSTSNWLLDSVGGKNSTYNDYRNWLRTDSTSGYAGNGSTLTAFNTDGFTLGAHYNANEGDIAEVSWTFRKQAKFFDIVTYTGGKTSPVSHNLGSTPGMILIKSTSTSSGWAVWHRGNGTDAYTWFAFNTTNTSSAGSGNGMVTSTTFDVTQIAPNIGDVNTSGQSYVAYLFAHDAGGFGSAGSDSIISCGLYTGNGSASGPSVTLGWEPQFIIIKSVSGTGNWNIFDNMRGIPTGSADPYLLANTTAAEATTNGDLIDLTPTGFVIKSTNAQVNTSSGTYIYLAIRRGPMKTPTDATKVFAPVAYTGDNTATRILTSGFPIDLAINVQRDTGDGFFIDRLRGVGTASPSFYHPSNAAEASDWYGALSMTGLQTGNGTTRSSNNTSVNYIDWFFQRAPSFFDVVCYTGTGNSQSVSHNLGVVPEFAIIKKRSDVGNFYVYSSGLGTGKYVSLNSNVGSSNSSSFMSSVTSTAFIPTTSNASIDLSTSGATYIAYLFATCSGVSKVGSYTGNGTSQTLNCGFSAGARFVLVKRTNSNGSWWVFDSARGIVSAADPALQLNSTSAETTSADAIDPESTGFIVNQETTCNLNVSSATYIYLAIA